VLKSVELLQENIKDVKIIRFLDKGHFTENSLGKKEFPELLEEILSY
jgi:hypothetical protein